jgi:glutamine amidotransferase
MIGIINYGLGNVLAFANIYKRLGIPYKVVSDSKELTTASRIILPGVGSFDWAIEKLNESGMRDQLEDMVLGCEVPILGVCVGMQIMAKTSDEGSSLGLGWIDADVKHFQQATGGEILRLPHMGWNDVRPLNSDTLFKELDDSLFYFLHSYYLQPNSNELSLALSHYEIDFTSAVINNNVMGVQFHPEKSHNWGIQLLKNFSEI